MTYASDKDFSELVVMLVCAARIAKKENDHGPLNDIIDSIETLEEAHAAISWLAGQFFNEIDLRCQNHRLNLDKVLVEWALRCEQYRRLL